MLPHIFGAEYSVYVRISRLCLIEKKVEYQLTPVDVFAKTGPSKQYSDKHPFDRIPYFKHGEFALYETGAITRYIDDAFEGVRLQPTEAKQRARCNQLISICDNYAYPHMVWGIYVERVAKPARNETVDDAKLADSLLKTETCLSAISQLLADNQWLVGEEITLADLYAAPMFDYFLMAPEGAELLSNHPNLMKWWSRMSKRSSMMGTKPV